MKVKASYEEITTFVKNHYKVAPQLKRIDDQTIEVGCQLMRFLPAITIQIKVEEIRQNKVRLVYESSAPMKMIITGVIGLFGGKMPDGVEINTESKQITITLGQIEKAKKAMEYVLLENIRFNEVDLEFTVNLK